MKTRQRRRMNRDQRPAQRRIDGMIAELSRGSADDALREAMRLALPVCAVPASAGPPSGGEPRQGEVAGTWHRRKRTGAT